MKFPAHIQRQQRTTNILPGTQAQKLAEAFRLVVLAAHPHAEVSWDPSPYGLAFRIEGVKLAPGRLCVWALTPEVASLVHIHPGLGESIYNRLADFAESLNLPCPPPGVAELANGRHRKPGMWAKGPIPGATPKADALALLPAGTVCRRVCAAGMVGYSVQLANGRQVGAGGSSSVAWSKAHDWALRNNTGQA